ncbi:hypothetical protein [Amycolatopsis sp. DSM 110486]|uniref:hypothetical protein n=1 Tax=Amycolatopsis sp. DSM 110486 TaxID=2865832 RepID=UPI001C695242|nr:hypothetical protein [Amycolatopsis sp. DSM 110486]QYN17567.1 hypothetical protein K1T34_32800 [Amycolatopsis sp. DSM 110486]
MSAPTEPDIIDAEIVDEHTTEAWNPDIRWFHPAVTGLCVYGMGFIPHWMNLSGLVMLPTGLALTAAGMVATRWAIDEGTYGARHEKHGIYLAAAAGASATAWLVWLNGEKPFTPTALGALVMWIMTFGVLYALFRSKEPQRKAARAMKDEETRVQTEEYIAEVARERRVSGYLELWEPWLRKAGVKGIDVEDGIETKAGYTLTLAADLVEDTKGNTTIPTTATLLNAIEPLAILASKHYKKEGIEVGVNQLRLEETTTAHEWLLHVSTKQPLKKSIPHPGPREPRSINEEAEPGIFEDGHPIKLSLLGRHVFLLGGTGSGKSVWAHNLIDNVLAPVDSLAWLCGVKKILPLVGPWLYPWLTGQTDRPVIDRIGGENVDEVLLMLADFYMICSLQNKRNGFESKRKVGREEPAITLFIDESSSLCRIKEPKVTTFDGQTWTASELINAICEVARSSGNGVVLISQHGLVDALGEQGTKILRNVTIRIVGKTNTAHDGQYTLNGIRNVDTTQLYNNTAYVQPDQERPRAIPSKALYLDEPEQIAPLAVAYTARRPSMPKWLVEEMGESYTGRWDKDRQQDLADFLEFKGLSYPHVRADVSGVALLGEGGSGAVAASDSPGELTGSADRGTLPVVRTNTAGQVNPPAGVAHQEVSMGSAIVHGNPVKDSLARLKEKAEAAREQQQRFLDLRSKVLHAITASNAPAWMPAGMLAIASKLAAPDVSDEELDAVVQELVEYYSDEAFDAPPETRDGKLGWDREVLKAAIRRQLEEERDGVPEQRTGDDVEATPVVVADVLGAIGEYGEDDWVLVGELGGMVGAVQAGEDPRLAAARFGQSLRVAPWDLPEEAFKRSANGKMVSVRELRKAALTR